MNFEAFEKSLTEKSFQKSSTILVIDKCTFHQKPIYSKVNYSKNVFNQLSLSLAQKFTISFAKKLKALTKIISMYSTCRRDLFYCSLCKHAPSLLLLFNDSNYCKESVDFIILYFYKHQI